MADSSPSALRNIAFTVFMLLAGVALVAVGAVLVVRYAPNGVRDLRAYEAAACCPAAPTAPAECRWTQEFTVSSARRVGTGKSWANRVWLTSANSGRWEAFYDTGGSVLDRLVNDTGGSVLDRLKKGDRVTATIWRGRLTEITAGGATRETKAAPVDMRTRVLIGALIIVPGGLVMTGASAWRLRRRTTPGLTPGTIAALGFGLLCGGVFCELGLGLLGFGSFWWMAAVWLPMVAILTRVALVHGGRPATRPAPRTFD